MNDMLQVIGLLGYVGLFWLIWKGLDWAYHYFLGDKVSDCPYCKRRDREAAELKSKVATLEREKKDLAHRLETARECEAHIGDYRLIQQLNTASEKSLERVNGIGPKRARQIVQNRPFYTMQEVRAILPNWLIQRARQRLGWGSLQNL